MSGLGSAIEQFAAMRVERTQDDDPNKVWFLRQNRLFAEATDAEVSGSQGIFTMCEMPRGTRVFDLGDTTRVVYLVKRGAVRIAREREEAQARSRRAQPCTVCVGTSKCCARPVTVPTVR